MIGIHELEHVGRIRRISIPDGWVPEEQPEDLFSQAWKVSFRSAENNQVELIIYYRGIPIDEKSAALFSTIAAGKPAVHGPEKLAPSEIMSLRIMMGFEHTGNNQYTNTNSPDTIDGPVFDLHVAEIRRIADQVVLFVSGKYSSGNHYSGIFYQADAAGRIIHQIGINSPTSAAQLKYSDDLDQILSSIEWHAEA